MAGESLTNDVSIHAPREGRDLRDIENNTDGLVSIHAPREGRDAERA